MSALWCVVELMGHRQRAGRVTEVHRFGVALMQIDIPLGDEDADGYRTEFYSGTAIYAFHECGEEHARKLRPRPARPPEEQRLLPAREEEDEGEIHEMNADVEDADVSAVGDLDEPGHDEPTYEPGGEP